MPLKHPTETVLVILLGIAVAVTGVVVDMLVPLPEGALPWGGALLIAVGYALLLHPILKIHRADYSFRAMHFLPVVMLLLWMLLQVGSEYDERVAPLVQWYTWGWTLPAVAVGFFLLCAFCIRVVRCRGFRCGILALLLVPYASFALMGEGGRDWVGEMASLLPSWDRGEGEVVVEGEKGEEERTLVASADPGEEGWRRRLRRMERREDRIDRQQDEKGDSASLVAEKEDVRIALKGGTEEGVKALEPPPTLPSSGGEVEILALLMLAGYCGVLQQRVQRRSLA